VFRSLFYVFHRDAIVDRCEMPSVNGEPLF
jgi:hypothetical protein